MDVCRKKVESPGANLYNFCRRLYQKKRRRRYEEHTSKSYCYVSKAIFFPLISFSFTDIFPLVSLLFQIYNIVVVVVVVVPCHKKFLARNNRNIMWKMTRIFQTIHLHLGPLRLNIRINYKRSIPSGCISIKNIFGKRSSNPCKVRGVLYKTQSFTAGRFWISSRLQGVFLLPNIMFHLYMYIYVCVCVCLKMSNVFNLQIIFIQQFSTRHPFSFRFHFLRKYTNTPKKNYILISIYKNLMNEPLHNKLTIKR